MCTMYIELWVHVHMLSAHVPSVRRLQLNGGAAVGPLC